MTMLDVSVANAVIELSPLTRETGIPPPTRVWPVYAGVQVPQLAVARLPPTPRPRMHCCLKGPFPAHVRL